MSTMTMGRAARGHGSTRTETTSGKGFFARMLDRAIEARTSEARLRAAQYLNYMTDARLAEIGLSAHDIQLMRDTGRVPPTLWS